MLSFGVVNGVVLVSYFLVLVLFFFVCYDFGVVNGVVLVSYFLSFMYKPNFQITTKILQFISDITAKKEFIANAQLLPQLELSLKSKAEIENAYASTNIEGNTLTKSEVEMLLSGKNVLKTEREKKEVLNYIFTLKNLDNLISGKKLSEKDIKKIHLNVVKGTLDKKSWEGSFRDVQVFVGNKKTGRIDFVPPKPEEIRSQLKDFLLWFNSENEIHPVIEAGITHYEIARIHPFVDGNGRVARVLALWVLRSRGFDDKRLLVLDDYYNNDRKSYYEALKTVDRKTLNMTKWLEYFTYGVLVAFEDLRQKVLRLSGGKRAEGRQIKLTPRQQKIVEYINQFGSISNKNVQEILGVKRQMATKELTKLVELGVIKKEGSFKDAKYFFVE